MGKRTGKKIQRRPKPPTHFKPAQKPQPLPRPTPHEQGLVYGLLLSFEAGEQVVSDILHVAGDLVAFRALLKEASTLARCEWEKIITLEGNHTGEEAITPPRGLSRKLIMQIEAVLSTEPTVVILQGRQEDGEAAQMRLYSCYMRSSEAVQEVAA